jgi:hypothetical protein
MKTRHDETPICHCIFNGTCPWRRPPWPETFEFVPDSCRPHATPLTRDKAEVLGSNCVLGPPGKAGELGSLGRGSSGPLKGGPMLLKYEACLLCVSINCE